MSVHSKALRLDAEFCRLAVSGVVPVIWGLMMLGRIVHGSERLWLREMTKNGNARGDEQHDGDLDPNAETQSTHCSETRRGRRRLRFQRAMPTRVATPATLKPRTAL